MFLTAPRAIRDPLRLPLRLPWTRQCSVPGSNFWVEFCHWKNVIGPRLFMDVLMPYMWSEKGYVNENTCFLEEKCVRKSSTWRTRCYVPLATLLNHLRGINLSPWRQGGRLLPSVLFCSKKLEIHKNAGTNSAQKLLHVGTGVKIWHQPKVHACWRAGQIHQKFTHRFASSFIPPIWVPFNDPWLESLQIMSFVDVL